MRERSSLSLGDIQSVLTNFVETMREILFNGQSVNIQGFGIFSLKARTKSAKTPEECGISNIKSVTIRFRPSVSIKPDLACTRAGEQLKFYEVKTQTPADAQAKPTTPTAPAIPAAPAAPEGGNDGNGNVDEEC
jgi:predicted histone-like DNA-binding protein